MNTARDTPRDFRIQAISSLAEDFTNPETGVIHKAGAEVLLVGMARYDKTHVLHFPLPNMTALFLDHAYVAWTASQILLRTEEFLPPVSKHVPAGTLVPKGDAPFFDLLQQRMVAIVFAFTALESFANESIPDGHVFRAPRSDGKCTEEYTKAQAEILSLDTKLAQILPPIFDVNTPRGTRIWERYILIKKLRDRIIHLKSNDRRSTGPDEDTIWRELLDKSKPNVALAAKDIIGYFLKKTQDKPRWFTEFPHKM